MSYFCHIAPTPHLNLVQGRPYHLVLAHLIEEDPVYAAFYKQESENGSTIIMDNSAFEMYKNNLPMYPTNKLIEMARKVSADYIALSDYPNEYWEKTIDVAIDTAPAIHAAGFGTFFIPQSEIGDLQGLTRSFLWAESSDDIDYIGYSILAIPNAYGVEKDNKLQRYLSRYKFMHQLYHNNYEMSTNKYHHFLGMVDGPNEIEMISPLVPNLTSWDSSAAIWAGLNDIQFDNSPSGLINGKFEKEVDFGFGAPAPGTIEKAKFNIDYIDRLWNLYI